MDFLETAHLVQEELSELISDKKLSGQFRIRERTRIINRWLMYAYNKGKQDMEKHIREHGLDESTS